jgi:hypothetical protein
MQYSYYGYSLTTINTIASYSNKSIDYTIRGGNNALKD